jgi:hypothetical protein
MSARVNHDGHVVSRLLPLISQEQRYGGHGDSHFVPTADAAQIRFCYNGISRGGAKIARTKQRISGF